MLGEYQLRLCLLILCAMGTGFVLFGVLDVPHMRPQKSEDCPTSERDPSMLPVTAVAPSAWVKYSQKWRGLPLPVLTCLPMGRLGNVMGEYATMYAIRRLYNISVVVHPNMKTTLMALFPNTTLPDLPGEFVSKEWRTVVNIGSNHNYVPVEVAAAGLLGPYQFVMKNYAIEIHMFNHFRDDIRREFTLAPTYAAEYLYGAELPGKPYFERALTYFRNMFPGRAVFITSSDDVPFIKSTLGKHDDVYFSPGTSALLDMAVLSSCNHSIITMGSYGFWTAYLAGGQVVYPDVVYYSQYRFSRAMYEKIGLPSFTSLPVD